MDDGHAALAEEARAVFGPRSGRSRSFSVEPIAHVPVVSATAGLWRVRCDDRSAVLKVLAYAPGDRRYWRPGESEDHWCYWRREADAYESGLLDSFAGHLHAPGCHLVAERPDGSVALWLEDLEGPPATGWSLARHQLAAHHVGQAQGEFATTRALPTERWLSRRWLRGYLDERSHDFDLLADVAAWRHPLLAPWFPDPPVDDLVAMAQDQDRYLAILRDLTPTVSHLDLHPANAFDAQGATTLIDWAFVGIGTLGEDAGNVVPDAVLDFHVPPGRIEDLYVTIAGGYHAGLQAAGCDQPIEQTRLAMAATIAAKYLWIAPRMLQAAGEGRSLLNDQPIARALTAWAPTVHFLIARAHEVTALTGAPP